MFQVSLLLIVVRSCVQFTVHVGSQDDVTI